MLHFSKRSSQAEILDDFELSGNDLDQNLAELARVNKYLGGYAVLKSGLKVLMPGVQGSTTTIVDVGCGGGDALRYMHKLASKNNWSLHLIGVDANTRAVAYARSKSEALPIRYMQGNVLNMSFEDLEADVLCFNLFLHHFSDAQIVAFLKNSHKKGAAILINDLERSKLAYLLFGWVSRLAGFSFIGRHDGRLSIKKAFIRRDWHKLLASAGIRHYSIRWKWAFRYLILIPATKM